MKINPPTDNPVMRAPDSVAGPMQEGGGPMEKMGKTWKGLEGKRCEKGGDERKEKGGGKGRPP